MEIHPSIPMTAYYGDAGRAAIPIETYINSSSHTGCNNIKHLGVPIVIALMYFPNTKSSSLSHNHISGFEQKMSVDVPTHSFDNYHSSPYVEIIDLDKKPIDSPLEKNHRDTIEPISDDVYDELVHKVLHSQLQHDSEDESDMSKQKSKKRSKKKH
jgi:hypothetical protein